MTSSEPFKTTGLDEQEKNADLAIYLLNYLEQTCDSHERIWRGDRDLRTLQYTSHAIDALHHLNLQGITNTLIGPACHWLVELQVNHEIPSEEIRALHIYPSRFKTLALLGQFSPARLMPDFRDLSRLFDTGTGWIQGAPFALSSTLVTLIWMDALLHLETLGLLSPDLTLKYNRALEAIRSAFSDWIEKAGESLQQSKHLPDSPGYKAGEIANPGDASYALDLLLRSGQLAPEAPLADQARDVLCAAIRGRRLGDMRRSDLIYCGLHLRTHFPQHPHTRQTVEAFLTDLRERYQNRECQREPVPFHALVLRMMIAHHGDQLRQSILEKLWMQSRQAATLQQRREQLEIETEFTDIIRQSVHIRLSPPERITGTPMRGEVYRLRFGLKTEATDESGGPLTVPRDTLSLIVKKGSPEVLSRAVERYRELPEPLQRLFARHVDMGVPSSPKSSTGYLLMQDLTDMQPLSDVLAALDRPAPRREEREKVSQAAGAACAIMQTLHSYERQARVVGHQFEMLYLAPMVDCFNRLCQPHAFPQIKQWVTGTVTVNGWTYKKFDAYLKRLFQLEARLRPPDLGFIHGDCHSRNLMLSRDLSQAKFVDIDTLARSYDYVADYGLLLEDVALYQSLPYGGEPGRIDWEDVQTSRPDNLTQTLDNWIAYPAFPQSETILHFQHELLGHLRDYAESRKDSTWKERLWLAIAHSLLLLASRQLSSQTIEPLRQHDGLRLVQIVYAEALRLLHELIEFIDQKGNVSLPDLPFPGAHLPVPVQAEPAEARLVGLLVESISQRLGDAAARHQPVDASYFIDYVTQPTRRLFARIHTKSKAPVLYLACPLEQLNDPHGLVQPADEGELNACIALTTDVPMPSILDLVQQAYAIVAASPT